MMLALPKSVRSNRIGHRDSLFTELPSKRDSHLIIARAIKARWCLDVRYGTKMDAVVLLKEWVQEIGSLAGLSKDNTCITSGSVGTPESRLELEVSFDNLAELEQFWASIETSKHKIWSERIQKLIVDGSPTWHIYRTVDIFNDNSTPAPSLVFADDKQVGAYGISSEPSLPSTKETTSSGIFIATSPEEAEVVLDWKGDPMKINPGDKLPFKF